MLCFIYSKRLRPKVYWVHIVSYKQNHSLCASGRLKYLTVLNYNNFTAKHGSTINTLKYHSNVNLFMKHDMLKNALMTSPEHAEYFLPNLPNGIVFIAVIKCALNPLD